MTESTMTAAQVLTFPATRRPEFPRLSRAVAGTVRKQVDQMADKLLRIASAEYGKLPQSGMRDDVAMERADELLCSLIEAAECERRKLLADIAFASTGP